MSWDYELAKGLKNMGRGGSAAPVALEGEVVKTSPLTISLYGGEVMAPPMEVDAVVCAQGFYRSLSDGRLYLEQWRTGDRVACVLVGQKIVILGKLGGTSWQIPER